MDVNAKLDEVRHAIGRAQMFREMGSRDVRALEQAADAFAVLDAHLSAGGTPPEVWREGPDAAGEPVPRPRVRQCVRCSSRIAWYSTAWARTESGRWYEPDLTEATYLLRGKLLYAKSEPVVGSSTGDRKWWLEDSAGDVLHDGVYSSLDVLERRHGLAEDQRPPIESL